MRCKKRGLFFVVLSIFLLVFSVIFVSATSGCYVYPGGNEDIYCNADDPDSDDTSQILIDDCDSFADCDLNTNFIPNSDCSTIPECQQVTCNVDCQSHALGWCQWLAEDRGSNLPGQAVSSIQFNELCTQGCCIIQGGSFCQQTPNLFECAFQGQLSGSGTNDVYLPREQCTNYCGIPLNPASLSGTVRDTAGALITVPVTVELLGTTYPSQTANLYNFPRLIPGVYQVRASANGYGAAVITVSLNPGEAGVQDFTLTPAIGSFTITGLVQDTTNNVYLAAATVSWTGPDNGQVFTLNDGSYSISGLPSGNYIIQASKAGYTFEQRNIAVTADTVLPVFNLQRIVSPGIKGRVIYELNERGAPGARIFVDGVFQGFAVGSSGAFDITGISPGDHQIVATAQGFDSPLQSFNLNANSKIFQNGQEINELVLALAPYVGECNDLSDYKDVDQTTFITSHVPGKEEVKLSWAKPCREVRGYEISKHKNGIFVGIVPASLITTSFIDTDVEWGQTYKYDIKTNYDQPWNSPKVISAEITLGDARCENRFHNSQSDTFCLLGTNRQKVYTCDAQNRLDENYIDCSRQFSPNYYCAPTSLTTASCKDAGACFQQNFNPFGLYSTAEACYGTSDPLQGNAVNYCYYDSTLTPVNSCNSCLGITNCFDYKSKGACGINSCFTEQCQWIDSAQYTVTNPLIDYSNLGLNIPSLFVTPETGTGYCVEVDYGLDKKSDYDDQCYLCGADGAIYENYYCTAEVCSSLGRCFSNPSYKDPDLTSCYGCGQQASADRNCYAYETELECNGGNPTTFINGIIMESGDSCSWGRCAWIGGACVKDGDASISSGAVSTGGSNGDCDSLIGIKYSRCRIDNIPPRTSLIPAGFQTISHTTGAVTFRAVDTDNSLGSLYYCLENANAPGNCRTEADFTQLSYPGVRTEETISEFLNNSLPSIEGQTYKLIYYSKDEFFNQENWKQSFLYVDTVRPQFTINYETITTGDVTDLTISLNGLNEPAACTFMLIRTIPPGGVRQTQTLGRDQLVKQVTFADLNGVGYDLEVECKDDSQNTHTEKVAAIFDLEQNIDIIHPPFRGAVRETRIAFQVNTLVAARCSLLDAANQLVASFKSDQTGKSHRTVPISGFIQKEYAGEYRVVCNDVLTGEEFIDYFHFAVDFTPPETQIILTEGLRESRPVGINAYEKWEQFFTTSAAVTFECADESLSFPCDKTFYCLNEGCELINDPDYKEYTTTLSITKSTKVCYYSIDVAGNKPFQPVCGDIIVDGVGIALINPKMHLYHSEVWGISSTPTFDWKFYTRIPTTECRFDFTPNFNYQNQPPHKIRVPDANGIYTFQNFPAAVFASSYPNSGGVKVVYVKCEDGLGALGPEQKIYLEYDPTFPSITSAFARPDPVVDGISTNLFVNTDDKTLCRYSDNSDGAGSNNYSSMEFSFPGESRNILDLQHQSPFAVNTFVGPSKEFKINTLCRNGAETASGLREIMFMVDYSIVGYIVNISPVKQSFAATTVPLEVVTSKDALCEYLLNNSYTAFTTIGGRTHTDTLSSLTEGEYVIPVRCQMGDHLAQEQMTFAVDFTSPVINRVDDGNYSCGNNFISAFVEVNETRIRSYEYELYDYGISTSGSGTVVLRNSSGPEQPIKIPTQRLTVGNRYTIKVKATDAAGNVGRDFVSSDGVIIVPRNHTVCQSDAAGPQITFTIDDSLCSSSSVQLKCDDNIGCADIKYGIHASSSLCTADKSYTGEKLEVDTTSFVCYAARDSLGHNNSGERKIAFDDADGDGIKNSCDKCANTGAGKVVDIDGCADGQARSGAVDTDKDSLPDSWEQTYNSPSCPLDYLSTDSNANNIDDNIEDYDHDGRGNFEEFLDNTHPCIKDTPPSKLPSGPAAQKSNIVAWVLLIIGLLMVMSGVGYLVYYYHRVQKQGRISATHSIKETLLREPVSIIRDLGQRLSPLRLLRVRKTKARQRQKVFEAFNTSSTKIPHLENVIKEETAPLTGLKKAAQNYLRHKEEVKPGLRFSEKSVFAALERIGKESKEKDIKDVVSTAEAKDIFDRLKKIGKKRKES